MQWTIEESNRAQQMIVEQWSSREKQRECQREAESKDRRRPGYSIQCILSVSHFLNPFDFAIALCPFYTTSLSQREWIKNKRERKRRERGEQRGVESRGQQCSGQQKRVIERSRGSQSSRVVERSRASVREQQKVGRDGDRLIRFNASYLSLSLSFSLFLSPLGFAIALSFLLKLSLFLIGNR